MEPSLGKEHVSANRKRLLESNIATTEGKKQGGIRPQSTVQTSSPKALSTLPLLLVRDVKKTHTPRPTYVSPTKVLVWTALGWQESSASDIANAPRWGWFNEAGRRALFSPE